MRPLPDRVDVLVIGAGAAGIAAARAIGAAGRVALVLEARDRVGGRAQAAAVEGRVVDLGAHWMHAARSNALVGEARRLGLALTRAPQAPFLVAGGRLAGARATLALQRDWRALERAILRLAATGEDRPAAAALEGLALGRPETAAFMHGSFATGVSLAEIGAVDFASVEDDADLVVAGGYGALVARLAEGLPIALGAPVERLRRDAAGVVARTPRGSVAARAAIVTAPVAALQAGALAFDPPLPAPARAALAALRPAAYEHVVLAWDGPVPRRMAHRTVALDGPEDGAFALLVALEGPGLHYADLGGPLCRALPSPEARADHVLAALRARFGTAATAGLRAVASTAWGEDPWSRGSWAIAPPGAHGARAALREPVDGVILLAGEATSPTRWGTVGGAYDEGARAAAAALALLDARPQAPEAAIRL